MTRSSARASSALRSRRATAASPRTSARRCAACRTTARSSTSPSSSPRATRSPCANRWRTRSSARGSSRATSCASSPPAQSWKHPCCARASRTISAPSCCAARRAAAPLRTYRPARCARRRLNRTRRRTSRTSFPASARASVCSRRRRCSAAISATRSKNGSAAAWSPPPDGSIPKTPARRSQISTAKTPPSLTR